MKLFELQERRSAVIVEMRSLSDAADAANRDLTAEESGKFDTLKTEILDLEKRIARAEFLQNAERSAPAVIGSGNRGDGSYEQRARQFSLQKAIRNALPRDVGGGGVDAGLEAEMSAEVERRSGRMFQGIAVPDEIFAIERRTLLAGSTAAPLVPEVHRDDLFIAPLRARLVTARLGATILDGLVGTVDIPKQTGSVEAQWVQEDGSLSESFPAFADVTLSAKTVGAMSSYSRRTLLNSSPSIEMILRNDLAAVLARAVDEKALYGNGTGNTPIGVRYASGVQEYELVAGSSGNVAWQDVVGIPSLLEGDDVPEDGWGWVLSPAVKAKLKTTTRVPSEGSAGFVLQDNRTLADYPFATTSAVPDDTLLFGRWSDLLIGRWSGIDILLNPYESTAYAKGRVLIRAMQDVDVAVRHGESFVYADNLLTP